MINIDMALSGLQHHTYAITSILYNMQLYVYNAFRPLHKNDSANIKLNIEKYWMKYYRISSWKTE